jgi:hypothetical protein
MQIKQELFLLQINTANALIILNSRKINAEERVLQANKNETL